MKNDVLLMQCGEALENCISAMVALGAPTELCELVEAKSTLAYLNKLFGLREDVSFSMLLAIFDTAFDTAGEDGQC